MVARAISRRRSRRRRFALRALLPSKAPRRRWWRAFRRLPLGGQITLGVLAVILVWAAANGVYQVLRKPTELFFPVSGALHKTPAETWQRYAPLFEAHATQTITADFLAALAQVESTGNPVARTYWRWSASAHPFEVYRPASSAVGMYQITDGTFEQARRYCIRDHRAIADGPWHDWRSCWFNALYFRVLPSHAIEMTSAYLDKQVEFILARHKLNNASLARRQEIAAAAHLCGPGVAERIAVRGLRASRGLKCGTHDAGLYIARVRDLQQVFARMMQ